MRLALLILSITAMPGAYAMEHYPHKHHITHESDLAHLHDYSRDKEILKKQADLHYNAHGALILYKQIQEDSSKFINVLTTHPLNVRLGWGSKEFRIAKEFFSAIFRLDKDLYCVQADLEHPAFENYNDRPVAQQIADLYAKAQACLRALERFNEYKNILCLREKGTIERAQELRNKVQQSIQVLLQDSDEHILLLRKLYKEVLLAEAFRA